MSDRWAWALEMEWSCPVHDQDVHERDEDGEREEPRCLDCWFGRMRVAHDEDGWAVLTFRERTPWERLMLAYTAGLVERLNCESVFLAAMRPEAGARRLEWLFPDDEPA